MTKRWEPGVRSNNGNVKRAQLRARRRGENPLAEEARALRQSTADDNPDPDTRYELRRIGVAI